MRFHSFILISFLFLALSLATMGCTQENAPETAKSANQPHIIYIITDDLGWGDLGVFYQNQRRDAGDRSEPWMSTPQLDDLAKSGAQMRHHYAAAPVCAPSRASLLLGQSQGHANVRDNQFDKALADNHTMASVLKEAGYTTAAVGKWGLMGLDHEPPDWPAHPLNRGFDYFLGYMRHSDGHTHYPKEGPIRGPKQVWQNRTNIMEKLDTTYTADLWTAAAKKWIIEQVQSKSGNNDSEEPFFLYLAYDTPHAPMTVPPQAYPDGGGLDGGVQWNGESGRMLNTSGGSLDDWIHPDYAEATYDHDGDPSTAEKPWPASYQRFATSVRRIDSGVGDLMKLLEDLGIRKYTLVVFTSDNGPTRASYLPRDEYVNYKPTFLESYGPFEGIKKDNWEGGLRMPTLASWPGHISSDTVITEPSISYDWLPTFADAAGLSAPANTDGVSLLPRLIGIAEGKKSNIYIEYYDDGRTPHYPDFAESRQGRRREQMQTIRMGDYIGVRYQTESASDDFEIYNVVKDPAQRQNLADNPEKQSFIQDLQQKMKRRVLQMRRPDTTASRPYDSAAVPSLDPAPSDLQGGLQAEKYRGNYPWVPKFTRIDPDSTAIIALPSLDQKPIIPQARRYAGYLEIPKTGSYTFYLRAATGALLRLHKSILIDADHAYENGNLRSETIRLEKGLHPFRLHYLYNGESPPMLQLEWSGPGFVRSPIKAGVFYH